MALSAGDKLGPYEILAPIGKGGMGEVYKAHDSRLRRDVAIKVGNEKFSDRFNREARAIASLNHTNVCHLYDVGPNYLVMEYVEGEDLKGPMSFEDALPIVQQLIDGIEAAHEKNIIHRDLKPANIKITPEGVVKILDFGLAKAMETERQDADPENSPTLTMGATAIGTILGTASYMSPEQAKGKTADKRSDIWSFGVILYEILTGKRLFRGDTAVEILGSVLNTEPDITVAPARAHKLLSWCLEKDRKQRLAAIGDARRMLEREEAPAAPVAARSKALRLVAAAGVVTTAIALWAPWRTPQVQDRPLVRLSVDLGPDAERDKRVSAVLSPDGSRIVYTTKAPLGFHHLYTRRLDQTTATLLTPDAVRDANPVFSPDGKWVAYCNGDKLVKVPAQGGDPSALGTVPNGCGTSTWADDDTIIATDTNRNLFRIAAGGGAMEPLRVGNGDAWWPQALPGAKAILVQVNTSGGTTSDDHDIEVITLATGERKKLIQRAYWPKYLPTSGKTGHIVFLRDHSLCPTPRSSVELRHHAGRQARSHVPSARRGDSERQPPRDVPVQLLRRSPAEDTREQVKRS